MGRTLTGRCFRNHPFHNPLQLFDNSCGSNRFGTSCSGTLFVKVLHSKGPGAEDSGKSLESVGRTSVGLLNER